MGKKKKSTIGYRYLMGLHMALGRGPLDEIVEIRVGDRTAYQGSITGNTEVTINKPGLFGGDDKEGGIDGQLVVLMGAKTQPVHAGLASMLGGLVPAFRGVATVFFDGLVCAMSPYPKPWAFRVRRSLQGWHGGAPWYPEKAVITLAGGAVRAMNPAHILYQVYTDPRMGRGLPAARLDDANWRAAADVFYNEGFGLCLKWAREDEIEAFAQVILDHVGASVYTSRSTGKIMLLPVRDDYDVGDLPHFTYDTGLIAIDDDEATNVLGATNEVIVKYRDPIDKQDKSVRAKNLGAIHASDGVTRSTTLDLPGIATADLALRAAQRELRLSSGYLRRFKLRMDRRGADIVPGGVFTISDPKRGIANMALRAGRCEYGTITDGTVTISCVQDVFGLPATSYSSVEPPGYVPPSNTPVASSQRRVFEAPYRELVQAMGQAEAQALDASSAFVMAAAVAPGALSLGYEVAARIGSSGSFETIALDGPFCPSGVLAADLPPGATSATVVGATALAAVQLGGAALLGEEIVRVDALDPQTGAITLGRGCADTTPKHHPAATRIFFYDDFAAHPVAEYVQGLTVQARLLTRTSAGLLDVATAPTDSLTMAARAARPYPPARLRINGAAWPATFSAELTVSWAHRNRTTQADLLLDTEAASTSAPAGVTYRLRIYTGATLRRTYAGLTGTSQTYSTVDEAANGGPFSSLRIVLDTLEDGRYSTQAMEWEGMRS